MSRMSRIIALVSILALASGVLYGQGTIQRAYNYFPSLTIIGPGTGVTLGNTTLAELALTGSLVASGAVTANGDMRVGAANFLYWNTRTAMQPPANALLNVTQLSGATVGYQINVGTAAPTATSCGSPTVTAHSNNMAGQIVAGAVTVCTVTFGAPAWTFAPFCTATDVTGARALFVSAASTTAITVSGLTASDTFNYTCGGGAI